MATVLATFLAVHPLGASLGEIAEYAQAFNPKLDYVYIQSLLARLPHVFQLSTRKATIPSGGFLGSRAPATSLTSRAGLNPNHRTDRP